jgi:hypothetical protein
MERLMKMSGNTCIAVSGCLMLAMAASESAADVDIVVDNFDSYANDAAWLAVWGETTGQYKRKKAR